MKSLKFYGIPGKSWLIVIVFIVHICSTSTWTTDRTVKYMNYWQNSKSMKHYASTHSHSSILTTVHWMMCILQASLSGTLLQSLPELVAPLKGHSLFLRTETVVVRWKVWALTRLWEQHRVRARTQTQGMSTTGQKSSVLIETIFKGFICNDVTV